MIEHLKQIANEIANSKARLFMDNQAEEAKRLEYIEINLLKTISELEDSINNIFFFNNDN